MPINSVLVKIDAPRSEDLGLNERDPEEKRSEWRADLGAGGTARVYITRVDASHSTHGRLVQRWHPPESASTAVRPFARRREAGWSNLSGSRMATTWRPPLRRRGWPAQIHQEQGCFYAVFVLGLTCVSSCGVVGSRCVSAGLSYFGRCSSARLANDEAEPRSTTSSPNRASLNCRASIAMRLLSAKVAQEIDVFRCHARWELPLPRRSVAWRFMRHCGEVRSLGNRTEQRK